ncbi:hypothetical protein FNV43_RR02007 [Rhamnella rubrinervis]|uniref:Glycoside hydrolase family 3 N-terminal domain-containing protein n=1 Tax=Rhamnella rubrinervis TaxID=2594499 RepID=A0A8K0HT36_9ROSA|nr:hypothetical protein FNV43_RR02007 [Rhamnella rubrinervis]
MYYIVMAYNNSSFKPFRVLSVLAILCLSFYTNLGEARRPFACDPSNKLTKSFKFCRTSVPISERVKDLIGRLTLQEKIMLLVNNATALPRLGIESYEWWSEALHGSAEGNKLKVAACCKHYTAYDLDNWNGVDRFHFNAKVSKQDLEETYNVPFKGCVLEGKVASVMCSYNQVNGKPTCADPDILKHTIRGEWGLNGYIVSDCDSVSVLYDNQHYTRTPEEAAADSINAGLDLDCGQFLAVHTEEAVKRGLVTESNVNNALANTIAVQMRLGMFDGDLSTQPFGNLGYKDVCTPAHQQLALEAAHQGIALHVGTPHPKALGGGNSNDMRMSKEDYRKVSRLLFKFSASLTQEPRCNIMVFHGSPRNSTHPTMTMEGMKKKLSEMRKSEAGEKKGNNGSEGSQSKKSKSSGLSLPSLTLSSLPSRPLTPTEPSGTSTSHISDIPVQTLEGSSSSTSMSIPPKLSYFAKCSTKILSLAAINKMEIISSDEQALLTTLGVKKYMALRQQATMAQLRSEVIDLRRGVMDQRVTISELKEKGRRTDVENRLKEDTLQKLQDSLSKSNARIKELEAKIEQKYPDLDLSWVYEADTGDTSIGGTGGTEDAGAKDTTIK